MNQEGYIESGEFKIHHVKWGEKGPKVLLIHSMGMDGHSMDLLAESLKDDYEVLSLTILGHGDSSIPKKPVLLPEHSEIMRDCYRQLSFYPNVLIGHSVGGMMGMVLTAEYPEEFKGLILVDIAPFESSGTRTRPKIPDYFNSKDEAKKWLKERYPGFTSEYVDNRLKYAFTKKDEKLWLKPRGDSVRGGLAIDLWPYVERIKTPVLLLYGEESTLVTPEIKKRMLEAVPEIEAIEVKGTGHMIPQDKPEEFEKYVKRFLEQVS